MGIETAAVLWVARSILQERRSFADAVDQRAASPGAAVVANVPSAAFTRSIAPPQSPAESCRNNRIVGYHGESSRRSIHRQSGTFGTRTQTGFAIAPARWATDVSTVTTRSN